MKHKLDAFSYFQQFKELMENQSGHCIKILRMDIGGEYVSNEFLNFCNTHGIHKQFTTRCTPQQNVVTERNNKTIMEMAHNMMASKHFPNEYWDESVTNAKYIMNQCPKKNAKNKVHQEAWSGMNDSVSHLKFVGCVTYAHVRYDLRKKLNKKGHKCIFVGYSEYTNA